MISTDWRHLAEEIAANNAVLFVGAGLSLNALPVTDQVTTSFKDWTGFMLQLAGKLWERDAYNKEALLSRIAGDFLYVTQLFKERFGDTQFYKEFLEAVPTQEYQPSELHRQLLSLPWTEYVTTNQDDLLEKTLRQLHTPFHSVTQDLDLSTSLNKQLIKMHGTWERPESLIFSEEDYRNYEELHPLIALKVKQLFAERTVFFAGFGMKDSNFKAIHGWIQKILGHHQKKAYAYIPNADEYTKTYWRQRNLIILSDEISGNDTEEWKYNFQFHFMRKIRYLNDSISIIRARKNLGGDIQKNYGIIKHLIIDAKEREVMEARLKAVEEQQVQYVKIAENMIKQWERAEEEGLSHHFAEPILRDIFFMRKKSPSRWYSSMPLQWFEYVLGEESDPGIRRKLLYLMKKYVEIFQTTVIVTYGQQLEEESICLYRYLRKRNEVPAPFKELLTTTYIRRLYYDHRNYRLVERLVGVVLQVTQNDLYLTELRHLRLLCLKNQFKYEELEQELRRLLDGQTNPKVLIRKGYFYLTLGRFEEAVDAYYRSVLQTENQEVALHALFSLQHLRRLQVSDEHLAKILDNLHLDNIEEQLMTRFGEETSRLLDFKKILSEHERSAIRCIGELERLRDRRERKNSWGSDNYLYEACIALEQYAELIEHNGLPDFLIAYNSAMRLVAERLILDGHLQLTQCYLGFGLNFKDLSLNDNELFLYRNKRSQLFRWMNGKIHQVVSMLENRSIKTDTSYFLLVKAADALLSQTSLLFKIIDLDWIDSLANPLTRILSLGIPAVNNNLYSTANKLLVRVINALPTVRSVEVFESYLRDLISTDYPVYYGQLDSIRFIGWSSRTLQSFHYELLTELLRKLLSQGAFKLEQYCYLVLNLHSITPLPEPLLAELKPLLLQIDEHTGKGQEVLIKLMIKLNLLSEKEIRERVHVILERYEKNSSIQMESLAFFAEVVNFLSEEEVDRILLKARSDKSKFAKSQMLRMFEEHFDNVYQYFFLQLAQRHDSPELWIQEFGMEQMSQITFYHMGQARQSFEKSVHMIDSVNKWLVERIIYSKEQERSSFLRTARSWIAKASTLFPSDQVLAGTIELFICDSSYEVKAWTISFITSYLSHKSFSDGVAQLDFFGKIKDLHVEETNESFMQAIAFFLNRFQQSLLDESFYRDAVEQWVEIIKSSPYLSVQLEWGMR